ncbi:hypothetical protein C4097_08840 [Clostridioides difficile]|nr:hypothetical protein [Clostridioides difficile]
MKVINECRIDFQYRLSPKSPVIVKTICSNVVSTDIVKDILKIEKYVDKKHSYSFDIVTYTVCISNVSKYIVTNAFFQDKIPTGTKFINNSVTINSIKKYFINPEKGFSLHDINSGKCIIITFKVIVLPHYLCNTIKNCSTIEHDYIYNIEMSPTRVVMKSNKVNTYVENKVFKSLQVDNNIKISQRIDKIIDIKVKVNILETKVVNTPANDVYRKQNSDVCTFIILGNIEYEINYKLKCKKTNRKNKNQKMKTKISVFGFSCNMLVPIGITYLNKDNIKINIENTSTSQIYKGKLFVSSNILLYY